jgi:hypothetical protein
MGNVTPRHSKSFHDGLNHHLTLSTSLSTAAAAAATTTTTTTTATSSTSATNTPNRSSWKKQLQMINDTFSIKKLSRRHAHGKSKRSRATADENVHPALSTSRTTQNFHDLIKHHSDKCNGDFSQKSSARRHFECQMNFKKSFSLFAIKQPVSHSTSEEVTIQPNDDTVHVIEDKSVEQPAQQQQQQQQPQPQPQPPAPLNSITNHSNKTMPVKESLSTKENQISDTRIQQKRRHKLEATTATTVTGEYSLVYFNENRFRLFIDR